MKKIFLLLILVIASISTNAQKGINYQAVVRDDNGQLMKNETITLEFSIIKNSASGTIVYTETHSVITNNFGNATAIIGHGTPVLGSFLTIAWTPFKNFLNVQINGTDMGTTEFYSVVHAILADKAIELADPRWNKNTSTDLVYNENLKVAIGSSTYSADALTVKSNNLSVTNELVDLIVEDFDTDHDVINMQVTTTGTEVGQFLEMRNNSDVMFRLNSDGKLLTPKKTGNTNMLPMAYGTVQSNGTITTSSNNVASVSILSTGYYSINITNENFFTQNYVVIATGLLSSAYVSWEILSGNIVINCRNAAGFGVNSNFSFVIYKP